MSAISTAADTDDIHHLTVDEYAALEGHPSYENAPALQALGIEPMPFADLFAAA